MRRLTTLSTLSLAVGLVAAACDNDGSGPDLNAMYAQVDRFGLPAIATVFIPSAQKDAYNQAVPAGDSATYTDEVVAVLTAFGHPNPPALAAALLPDILPIDVSTASGFLNGRRLQDDVITAELGLIFGSNASLNDDHVDANDKAFLSTFPYLAAP
jgi:hypothetical protein